MQSCVLTEATQVGKCEIGEHGYFADPEQIPFEKKGTIGSGGYGQVEKVVSRITSRQYARKLLHRKAFGRFQENLAGFENELNLLKQVRHQHIVEIVGSYTDPRYTALIMSPVADCDLSYFLKQAPKSRDSVSSLRTFSSAVSLLESRISTGNEFVTGISNRPNILVYDGTILLTDFGLSRDCNNTRSTTEGPTARTAKYCAPEVADDLPRSFSSDIWSLRCVYLETITILKGYSLDDMMTYFEFNGAQTTTFWRNSRAVAGWMTQLRNSQAQESDNAPFEWIEQMLRHDRNLRPLASVLATEITHRRSLSDRIGEFCGIYCRIEDENFSNFSDTLIHSRNSPESFVKPSVEDLSDLRMDLSSNIIPNDTLIPSRNSPELFVKSSIKGLFDPQMDLSSNIIPNDTLIPSPNSPDLFVRSSTEELSDS